MSKKVAKKSFQIKPEMAKSSQNGKKKKGQRCPKMATNNNSKRGKKAQKVAKKHMGQRWPKTAKQWAKFDQNVCKHTKMAWKCRTITKKPASPGLIQLFNSLRCLSMG